MARILDQKTVDALTLDDGQFIFDSEPSLRGFGVRLRRDAKGRLAKTWIVQYRVADGQRRRTIGNAARMTAIVARKKAAAWIAEVEKGNDPGAAKDEVRKATAMKFSKAVEDYLRSKDGKVRQSSFKITRLYLTGPYFAKLHSMPVSKVTRSHISEALDAIDSKSGTVTAVQCRRHLNAFFVWCLERGHCDQNAVVGSAKFDQGPSRDRILDDAELAKVWNATDVNTDIGRIVRLLILTGARRKEIGGLKWSEVDLEKAVITLPKERTKNGHAFSLPLAPAAVEIIKSIPQVVRRDFVFGSYGKGFSGWNEKKQKLGDGCAPWSLHDLRRTFRSGLGRIGVPPHIAERCVNHIQGGVQAVYDRYTYEGEIADAMARWADHVTARKVIPLRQKSA